MPNELKPWDDETPVGTCSPDYEREYYRLIEEVGTLKRENVSLRDTILEMCKKLFVERRFDNA